MLQIVKRDNRNLPKRNASNLHADVLTTKTTIKEKQKHKKPFKMLFKLL